MKLCWGVEGCTWETQCCQQATLGGKWRKKKKIPWVSRLPLILFFLLLLTLHDAFWSFREGIYPLHWMTVSRSSLEGAPNCVYVPSSPLCFCWVFVSPPQPLLLLPCGGLPSSPLQVLVVPFPQICPSHLQRGCISLSPGNVAFLSLRDLYFWQLNSPKTVHAEYTPAEDCERQVDFAVHSCWKPTLGYDVEAEADVWFNAAKVEWRRKPRDS